MRDTSTRRKIKKMVSERCYVEFGEHKDLKGLCCCGEDFGEPHEVDFEELVFIVPLDWLMNYTEMSNEELTRWLNEEYTGEDSKPIFDQALRERKIVMVDFN